MYIILVLRNYQTQADQTSKKFGVHLRVLTLNAAKQGRACAQEVGRVSVICLDSNKGVVLQTSFEEYSEIASFPLYPTQPTLQVIYSIK